MTQLTNKERMQIKRQEMPTQEPEVRQANFEEVALGLTWELAQLEADRCLQCAKPHCVDGCPVGVQIPAVHQGAARCRFPRRGRGDEGQEQPPRDLRPGLPARVAVRGLLHPGQEGAVRGYWPPRAVRGRLRAPRERLPARCGSADRPQGRGRGLRSRRSDLRGGPGQARAQGHDLRIAAPARRRV